METKNHINNVHYLDVRGSADDTSKKLGVLGGNSPDMEEAPNEFSSEIISLASPDKISVKLKDFLGNSEFGYEIASFSNSFTGEDSILLLKNISELIEELGITITFFEDHGAFDIPGYDKVIFALDGTILESNHNEVLGMDAFHYLLCFIDQDFAAILQKDGQMLYACDISCFEKTPKSTDGSNSMIGANFLDFHSEAPTFGGELSRALPKILERFRDHTLDMLVVDLNGQREYELSDGSKVYRYERDKFFPLFDENGEFKGFFGLADVLMKDVDDGTTHPEIQTQTDLLRTAFRSEALYQSIHPELLLSDLDDNSRLQVVKSLLADKDLVRDKILELATELSDDKLELYGISYISDTCVNDCRYCGHNSTIDRKRSSLDAKEMSEDFEAILKHKPDEFCILSGESADLKDLVTQALSVLCKVNERVGSPLKRISLNIAPMSEADFREIVETNTSGLPLQFRVFQETYDKAVYNEIHTRGPKKDFQYRITAQDRALSAGFDSVGIGALLGINPDSDNEILSLVQHALNLKRVFGKFPNSLSIPRHQPVDGYDFQTPAPVDNKTYIFYHAILRLALPEIKLMITSRESESLMRTLEPFVGIRDLAPRPGVGGNIRNTTFQNELGDSRSAEEIIADLVERRKR